MSESNELELAIQQHRDRAQKLIDAGHARRAAKEKIDRNRSTTKKTLP